MNEEAVRRAYREISKAAGASSMQRVAKIDRAHLWAGIGHLYDAIHAQPDALPPTETPPNLP